MVGLFRCAAGEVFFGFLEFKEEIDLWIGFVCEVLICCLVVFTIVYLFFCFFDIVWELLKYDSFTFVGGFD